MTQVYQTNTPMLRMARRGSSARELTSKEKRMARHMAWDNATAAQIAKAINWPLCHESLRRRLRAINIRSNTNRRQHTEVRR